MNKTINLLIIFVISLAFKLAADPSEDFLKTIKGVTIEKEIHLQNKQVKFSVVKFDKELDLTKVSVLPQRPQTSPFLLMQAMSYLLTDLDEEKAKTIKSYHTSEDVIQIVPASRIITIMKKNRKDWKMSSIVRSGDLIFLCGNFKDANTGKAERDIWPMTYFDGNWYVVVSNKIFISGGGLELMEYLNSGQAGL